MSSNLVTTRGDTLNTTFTLGVNITGWTLLWTLKRRGAWYSAPDSEAVLQAAIGTGLAVTDATTGVVALTVAATTTATWDPEVYVWDLQGSSAGTVRTVEWTSSSARQVGTLTVVPDVTRS